MIKLLLSHYIFEACVNHFFGVLHSNFPIGDIDISNLELGSYISVSIVIYNKQYKLLGCKVVEKTGNLIMLEYTGFSDPILLIAENGKLVDIKGDISILLDSFMETYV